MIGETPLPGRGTPESSEPRRRDGMPGGREGGTGSHRLAALLGSGSSHIVPLGGLALAAAAGGLVAAIYVPTTLALILAIAFVALAPIVVLVFHRTIDPFEPIVISSAAAVVFFVARPLYDLSQGRFMYAATDVSPWIDEALIASLIALTAFTIGYFAVRPVTRLFPEPPAHLSNDHLLLWGALLLGLAVAGLAVATVLQGGFETLLSNRSQIDRAATVNIPFFSVASLVSIPALFLLAAVKGGGRTLARPLIVVAAAILLIGALPKGDRREILPLLFAFLAFPYIRRGRRPGIVILVLATALAFLFVVAPLRSTRTASEDYVTAVVDSVADIPGALGQLFSVQDTAMLNTVALGIGSIGTDRLVPLQGGSSIAAETLLLPIPRALWPGKPETIRTILIDQLYGYGEGRCVALCPTFTGVISLYADFGLPLVALGAFLIGALFRSWYGWYERWRDRYIAQAAFAVMALTPLWLWWGSVGRTLTDFFTLAVPVILGGILATHRVPGVSMGRRSWGVRSGVAGREATGVEPRQGG